MVLGGIRRVWSNCELLKPGGIIIRGRYRELQEKRTENTNRHNKVISRSQGNSRAAPIGCSRPPSVFISYIPIRLHLLQSIQNLFLSSPSVLLRIQKMVQFIDHLKKRIVFPPSDPPFTSKIGEYCS